MGATASNVPLKRLRDLLALARSDNEHEAALARQRADELLAKYPGVREEDLRESATEILSVNTPTLEGSQRGELARIVAYSRGVSVVDDGRVLGFRGYPEAARDARELANVLIRIVETTCELPDQQPENDRFLWRTCYWLGYVTAIKQQLDPEHMLTQEAINTLVKTAKPDPILERAAAAFDEMRGRLKQMGYDEAHEAAQTFKSMAYESGLNTGSQIAVPPYKGKR